MAASTTERLPLLVGRVAFADKYVSVHRRGPRRDRPDQDVTQHHAYLTSKLDAIWKEVARRERADRDPGTDREIIAIHPKKGEKLEADSLGDRRLGMRVISVDEQTGIVLVDASRPDLPHIRSKLDKYADDSKVSAKTGARGSEDAVAPIGDVRIARIEDLLTGRLQLAYAAGEIVPGREYWFELGCRGGQRASTLVTDRSRQQIARTLERLRRPVAVEFLEPEQVIFFVRASLEDLSTIVSRVDCVFEVDLTAPPFATGCFSINGSTDVGPEGRQFAARMSPRFRSAVPDGF